jgi:Spy/CpxP family protein refolding chaperone
MANFCLDNGGKYILLKIGKRYDLKSVKDAKMISKGRHIIFSLCLLIGSFVFAFCSVYAQQTPQPQIKTILDYKEELKLTKEQIEKIKAYFFDFQRETQEMTKKLNTANSEILKIIEQGTEKRENFKITEVEAKIREAHQIRADMAIAEVRTADRINRILTAEQFEKWKKILKEGRKGEKK